MIRGTFEFVYKVNFNAYVESQAASPSLYQHKIIETVFVVNYPYHRFPITGELRSTDISTTNCSRSCNMTFTNPTQSRIKHHRKKRNKASMLKSKAKRTSIKGVIYDSTCFPIEQSLLRLTSNVGVSKNIKKKTKEKRKRNDRSLASIVDKRTRSRSSSRVDDSPIDLRVAINKLADNSCSVIIRSQNGDFLLAVRKGGGHEGLRRIIELAADDIANVALSARVGFSLLSRGFQIVQASA